VIHLFFFPWNMVILGDFFQKIFYTIQLILLFGEILPLKNPRFWPFFIFKFLTLKIWKVFWKISWIYTLKKFFKISQLFFHKIDKISQKINYYSKPRKISINHRAKIICSQLSWNHQPFHQAFKEPHVVGSSNFSHGLFSQLYTLDN
jgi:hypothetical protein